ncbi:MAG: hypothetical protein R3A10_09905 [Caldilineaceae bacterium]
MRLSGHVLDGDIIEEIHESAAPRLGSRLSARVTPYTYDRLSRPWTADLVVLGVNSLGIDWAAEVLGPVLPADMPLLLPDQGLEGRDQSLSILPRAARRAAASGE